MVGHSIIVAFLFPPTSTRVLLIYDKISPLLFFLDILVYLQVNRELYLYGKMERMLHVVDGKVRYTQEVFLRGTFKDLRCILWTEY